MVDMIQGRASFSTHPPTPPKERIEQTTKLASDNAYFANISQHAIINTPDDSPSSSGEYFGGSSDKGSKRVGFSPWTKYHKPLSIGSKNTGFDGHMKSLPPSRDCKSSKSILKPYVDSVITPDKGELPASDYKDIPAMLRSSVQHLASPLRSSRVDAYCALLGCLNAYKDVPEVQELVERSPELTEFIRRDINARHAETGALDTQLATQALKLLTALLCIHGLADSFSDDFCSFIVDRSISIIEDQTMPKILVSHYMHLLVKQDFSFKVMSNDRMSRLLQALRGVVNRIKGNRIVGHRLMIYQRLLTQTKPQMILYAEDWIDHLITGMLSSIKDIRHHAIAFGVDAGLLLGNTISVSQACIDVFNRASPEGKRGVDFLASRLNEMVSNKEDAVHVPQIWSVVILFLRSRRHQLERWEHMKDWLLIIQRCFNSGDVQVKFQANLAWNRLIYAINPEISTSPTTIKMLRQPIVSQLERKTSERHSKQAKHIARSSYCTLLYYAFSPLATHAQLDLYWEEYISQVIPSTFSASSSEINHACEVMAALFGNTTPNIWDENRVNRTGRIKPDELPRLDPKWVRSRSAKVLMVFERIFASADWQLEKLEEAPVILAWRNFTAAVGEAGNKEVKVSMASMTAVAHILTTIKHFWERSCRQQQTVGDQNMSNTLQKFYILVKEAVAKVGSIPFNEKRLVQSSQDSFEAAETPSSRSVRYQGSLSSPVTHLINILISNVEDNQVTNKFNGIIRELMQIACHSATSKRTQLGILRDQAALLSVHSNVTLRTKLAVWQLIAEATGLALISPRVVESHSESPQYAGHEYREAVKILEIGIKIHPDEAVIAWQRLKTITLSALNQEIGDAGVILALTEPLAHTIHQEGHSKCNAFLLDCATALLQTISWPQSRQLMERARKLLWGVSSTPHKPQSLDPFDHIYSMVDMVLGAAYSRPVSTAPGGTIDFLSAVTSFISSCPSSLKAILLKRIQAGLGLWIEDCEGLMTPQRTDCSRDLYISAKKMWAAVIVAIEGLPKADNTLLRQIPTLVNSSLKSRHQGILNDSVTLWNHTFGNADFIEYPDDLHATLLKLRSFTEMQLPNFPDEIDAEIVSSPYHFIESQNAEDDKDSRINEHKRRNLTGQRETTPKPFANLPLQSPSRSSRRTPVQNRVSKTTPVVQLRHNDSQVHFAAIESSPLVPEAPKLQMLTEHQREVKERQGYEAAVMFPDIRSSPRSRSREQEHSVPKLILGGSHGQHADMDADDEISPMFPPADAMMDEFLGSSPTPRSSTPRSKTPRSSRQASSDEASDNEPPSSPPKAPSFENLGQTPDLSSASADVVHGRSQLHGIEKLDVCEEQMSKAFRGSEPILGHNDRDIAMVEEPETISKWPVNLEEMGNSVTAHYPSHSDACPSSSLDVFVDANPEPSLNSEAVGSDIERRIGEAAKSPMQPQAKFVADQDPRTSESVQQSYTPPALSNSVGQANDRHSPFQEDDTNRIMDSFFEASASFHSTEDDQIAAQLVSDMQLASSQFNIQVLVETRKPGVSDDDCVILDTRPAVSKVPFVGQEVKQERSLSPSRLIWSTPAAPTASIKATRRTRSSTAGGSPSHQSLPPRKKRKGVSVTMKTKNESGEEDSGRPKAADRRRSTRPGQTSMEPLPSQTVTVPLVEENDGMDISPSETRGGANTDTVNRKSKRRLSLEITEEGEADSPSSDATSNVEDTSGTSNNTSVGVAQDVIEDKAQLSPKDTIHVTRIGKRKRASRAEEVDCPEVAMTSDDPMDDVEFGSQLRRLDATRRIELQHTAMQLDVHPEMPNAVSAQRVLRRFRQLLGEIKQVMLGPEEEREMMGMMLESGREVQEAACRFKAA